MLTLYYYRGINQVVIEEYLTMSQPIIKNCHKTSFRFSQGEGQCPFFYNGFSTVFSLCDVQRVKKNIYEVLNKNKKTRET